MDTLKTVIKAIETEPNAVVFISTKNWGICRVDEPRVRGIAEQQQIPFYHLDLMDEPELASYFEVLTVPAVMVYHHGQEALRQARFIGHRQIKELLEKLPQNDEPTDYDRLFD